MKKITLSKVVLISMTMLSTLSFAKLTETEYKKKTGLELAQMVRDKKVTSEDLVKLAFEIEKKENPKLNAVIYEKESEALQKAKKLKDSGQPFLGVPIFMKGLGTNHQIKGIESTFGLVTWKGNIPKEDGALTKKLKDLGFIILGSTNYPEFGMRDITQSPLYGKANNPWDLTRNTGGSSGGSAAVIASGMVPVASGSDGGGSIRIPSSWTGLIGLKPSRGMIFGNRYDHELAVHFPLVKSSKDAEVLLEKLTNPNVDKKDLVDIKEKDLKKLTIGYTTVSPMGTPVSKEAKEAVMKTVKFLRSKGFKVEECQWPVDGVSVINRYTTIMIDLAKYFGNLEGALKAKGLDKYSVDPLDWALYVTYRDMDKAELAKEMDALWKDAFKYADIMAEFHKKYPIMLTPTNAWVAPKNTDDLINPHDKEEEYNVENLSYLDRRFLLVRQWGPMLTHTPFTEISNFVGEPAINLPVYVTKEGLPLGVMLNASWGWDQTLVNFAKYFEDNNQLIFKKDIR